MRKWLDHKADEQRKRVVLKKVICGDIGLFCGKIGPLAGIEGSFTGIHGS